MSNITNDILKTGFPGEIGARGPPGMPSLPGEKGELHFLKIILIAKLNNKT